MFAFATKFNQDVSTWNTGKVYSMRGMFVSAGTFNQNLYQWNISKVVDMDYMFEYAELYNQNLCRWGQQINVKKIKPIRNMFRNTSCPTINAPNLTITPKGPFCYIC